MDERVRPTRSGLFTIELLIAVGVFTFCAAICVGLFVRADVMSRDSADLTRAVNAARNVAELFKVSGGDVGLTASLAGGQSDAPAMEGVPAGTRLSVAYDEDWEPVSFEFDSGEPGAEEAFRLDLSATRNDGYVTAELWITRRGGTAELLKWQIAALEGAAEPPESAEAPDVEEMEGEETA